MMERYIEELERGVSSARLSRYRSTNGTDIDLVVNYFWNIALSESMYPGLAALEITLRNAIHSAITTELNNEMWFYEPGLLEPQQLRDFASARLNLFKVHANNPTPGLIVAQLNFGFWTTLLSRNYHESIWSPGRAAALRSAFPFLTGNGLQRHLIHQRYNSLRFLRNRIAHCEPIFQGIKSPGNRSVSLVQMHTDLIEAIGWVNPMIRDSITLFDHFDQTFRNGKERIEDDLKTRFNL